MRADLGDLGAGQPPPRAAAASLQQLRDLFDARYITMVTLAQFLVGDRGSAEEVVQEAFIRLHHRLEDLEDPPAYLRVTVVNLARSAIRRRQMIRRYQRRQSPEAPVAPDGAEGVADREAIMTALRALPRRQREVLALRYYLGLGEREIAETLGISTGSVKTHASRGLEATARLLGEER